MNATTGSVNHQQQHSEASSSRCRRHDEAVIEAEVRRLMHTIRPAGIMPRDTLALAAGADGWQSRQFDRSPKAALNQGQLEARPFGYYREARNHDNTTHP